MKQLIPLVCAGVALALMGAAPATSKAAPQKVRVLPVATTNAPGGHYLNNRAPLAPAALLKLPVGSITPQGWLRHQLELEADGLVGRLPEVSRFLKFEGNGWVDAKSNEGWEELPYWLRGYGDLGYVLGDQRIIGEARKWIDGIIANQRPDGYFGPERLKTAEGGKPDLWPHMLVLDALHSYYEHSGDERVPAFMLRYFKWQDGLSIDAYRNGWGALRWADNMAEIYWLYNKTGQPWLLDLARKIHEHSVDYTTGLPNMHNVNLAQGIREPAEFWMQAKDPKFLNATELNYQKIMGQYGQFAGGGFAGDENIRPAFRDPRQGFETCGFVEFMHTFEMMTRISGQPLWADRTEEIAFNSLPAALTPDHRGIHYITPANVVELNHKGVSGQFQNRFDMLPFRNGAHDYRCCPHNYGMGWPYYAEELWLATADKGLCASLYAASEVKAKVGDGTLVKISEETDYPFSDTIGLRVSTPRPVNFPLYLRVPRWCRNPTFQVNGKTVKTKAGPLSYAGIERTWRHGDVVTLRLPMQVALRTWEKNKNSVSVDYGPLTFSLAIDEKWARTGGSDAWPEWEVLPASAWNYGLELDTRDPARSFEVLRRPGPLADQPFVPGHAPITLRVRARKIPGWQTDREGIVQTLQQSPARSAEPSESVTLIPMGAARLRVTSFPTIGGPNAHQWTPAPLGPKFSASHVNGSDSLEALGDQMEPATSGDQGLPRFTWWDRKGTTEWVQRDFDKPATVSAVALYWYDDTGRGGVRVPQSWRLLYKDGDAWKPVEEATEYGTAKDRFNRTSFKPVTTAALRVEAKLQNGFSGGILEWKVETNAARSTP